MEGLRDDIGGFGDVGVGVVVDDGSCDGVRKQALAACV